MSCCQGEKQIPKQGIDKQNRQKRQRAHQQDTNKKIKQLEKQIVMLQSKVKINQDVCCQFCESIIAEIQDSSKNFKVWIDQLSQAMTFQSLDKISKQPLKISLKSINTFLGSQIISRKGNQEQDICLRLDQMFSLQMSYLISSRRISICFAGMLQIIMKMIRDGKYNQKRQEVENLKVISQLQPLIYQNFKDICKELPQILARMSFQSSKLANMQRILINLQYKLLGVELNIQNQRMNDQEIQQVRSSKDQQSQRQKQQRKQIQSNVINFKIVGQSKEIVILEQSKEGQMDLKQIQQWKQVSKRMEKQLQQDRLQFQKTIEQLKRQYDDKMTVSNFQKEELQKQIKHMKQTSEKTSQNIIFLNRQLTQYQQLNSILKQKNNNLLFSYQKLQKQLEQSKELLKKQYESREIRNRNMRSYSFVEHKTFFIGELLQSKKAEKKFLIDSIQTHMTLNIEKTKSLYEYKRDKAINFNTYITGLSNLVLIVKTEKALIAGYYSGKLENKEVLDDEALLISMNNREKYVLNNLRNNPNKDPRDIKVIKGMIYDKFFMIFGNAELRIKTGENKLFSNFAKNGAFFDNRKHKLDQFLCDGTNNQVELINYEIHQVFFEEPTEQVQL